MITITTWGPEGFEVTHQNEVSALIKLPERQEVRFSGLVCNNDLGADSVSAPYPIRLVHVEPWATNYWVTPDPSGSA